MFLNKEEQKKESPELKKYSKKWWIEQIRSFSFAILLVLILRSSFIEAFKIPSGSMIPTLLVGDHIFVNKLAFGFKLPFSDFFTDTPVYLTTPQLPKRGDIVVFKFPKDTSYYFIKRVIGLPGDKIIIRNKEISVNGKSLVKKLVNRPDIMKDVEGKQYDLNNLELFEESDSLDPNKKHLVLLDKNNIVNENFGEIVVPKDNIFVMGDNRDFSNDSRFWGYVPFSLIRGKALFIWFSVWLDFGESTYFFKPFRIGTFLK